MNSILIKYLKSMSILGIFSLLSCNINNPSEDSSETVKDIDGNIYYTVKIGKQTWITTNFRATRLNDGTLIPKIVEDSVWIKLSTPGYCFDHNTSNRDSINKFGALYNWYVVKTGKIAPPGWHVPDTTDWNNLEKYLVENGYNWDGTTLEDKTAKALAAKTDWHSNTTEGSIGCDLSKNNKSGFTALPCGCRDGHSGKPIYADRSTYTMWWTSTEELNDSKIAYHRDLYCSSPDLFDYPHYKETGMYLRLIKN